MRKTLRPVGREAQSIALASTPGTVILGGGNQDGVGTAYGLLEMANNLGIGRGLEILIEEGQGADVEELNLDPVWCELPGSTSSPRL